MVNSLSLRVPKRLGQRALQAVGRLHLIDSRLKVWRSESYVFIPLARKPSDEEVDALRRELQVIAITVQEFPEKRAKSLLEALEDSLPPHLLASLPRSMDIIGRIAIVEVPPELEGHKSLLGEAVLRVHGNVETVLAKAGAVDGKYRLRRLEVIAGTGITETVHREHGCVYHLDPTKVYFSPRLSQERWRIAQKVRGGEVVVDMFAGVGPFSIQIAKKHGNVKVYAVDANPSAIQFLKRNIIANKVENVFPILGDAEEVVEESLAGKADRVIMNLPERAIEFIDVACKALKPSGGVIHYYGFAAEPNALEKGRERLDEAISRTGKTVRSLLDSRLVRPTAPREWQVAVDVLVS